MVREKAPTPAALLWLRWSLWALLAMVLCGLFAVWWTAKGERAAGLPAAPPVLKQLPDFEFTTSSGSRLTLGELDRPWIADFVFTRCAVTCPRMTSKMKALGSDLPPGVRRVSVTVDPDYDTPEVLREYARSYGIGEADDWLFLTGPSDPLRRLIVEGFLLGVSDVEPDAPGYEDEPITHSTRFVLIDGTGGIRGYYDAFDERSVARLHHELEALLQENAANPASQS